MFEREVLELPAELRHTEAVRERSIEVAGLLRDAAALLGRQPVERPHVVETVGQLDDDDARVLGDREEQLAVALDLALLSRPARRQLGDLRQPVDDRGDLFPEFRFDVGERESRVLDDVVQETAGDGDRVELEVGEDLRHLDRVRDVRVAGVAQLAAMGALAEAVGAHEQLTIELVVERRLALAPSGNQLLHRRCRHSRPASAKLVYRPRPMITWSCTGMSSNRPAATSCSVTARSSGDGAGSPLGWLCTKITAAARSAIASRNTSRG